MSDSSRPIILTRTISLPFPPFEGLRVFGKQIDVCPEPEGLGLSEILWDMDRGVFLATTKVSDYGCPFGDIPIVIHEWITRGWKWGSHRDRYAQAEPDDAEDNAEEKVEEGTEDELLDELRGVPLRKRPKELKRAFKAMIRHLAESFDLSVAYAMDKTGMYFEERPDWDSRTVSPQERAFGQRKSEFEKQPEKAQSAWRKKVLRYRSFEHIVRRLRPGSA